MSLVLALALVTIGPAPVRPAIRWEAPAACPSQAAFLARIPGLHDPGTRWADVSAHARVRVLDEGFGLELTLRSASGSSTRHARATACEPLADAAALILATFVEPVATAQRLDAPHAGDAPPHASPTAAGHDAAAPHARIRELQPCPPATPAP
ncbi:MAG: hypothetical protein KDK70_43325, partial [Myxococcales bacterium]|nr:hypothetical protein [Myxococcales bacterium]